MKNRRNAPDSRPAENASPRTLRARAEVALQAGPAAVAAMPIEDVRALVRELQVHQVELELQNEELRLSQAELADSRDRFNDLYDFSPVGYLTLDRKGTILKANLTVAKLLGVVRRSVAGRKFHRFVARASQDTLYLHTQQVFLNPEPTTCELVLRKADGTPLAAQLLSVAYEDPGSQTLQCHTALHDISQWKAVERELRESEERSRLLVELSPNLIGVAVEGNVVFLNAAGAKLLGAAGPDELLGRPVIGFVHPASRKLAAENLRRLREGGEPVRLGQEHWLRLDGTPLQVDLTAFPFRYQNTSAICLMAEDMTGRLEAERQLKRNARRLQSLSQRLVASQENERRHIARELHDQIGQSLAAVQINLETALALPDGGRVQAALRESVQLVDELIQQTQDLSLSLRPSLLDDLGLEAALRWLLNRQASRAGLRAELRSVRLDPRPGPEVETACFRVVQEALTNVIRHARARKVEVRLKSLDGTLQLSVEDDGRGFDVEAVREAMGGGGLGLLGMEERVALLGGRFDVLSKADRGTKVRAWLPLGPSATAAATYSTETHL